MATRYIYGNDGDNVIYGSGYASDYIFGFGGDDILYGYAGLDILDGGTGNDYMVGGWSNDTYYVDSYGDVVVENGGDQITEGTNDLVWTTLPSYVLPDNVEVLAYDYARVTVVSDFTGYGNASANTIHGWTGNDTLYGGGGNDTLYGYGGNDVLDGGCGADNMVGGDGNDVYYVDNSGDVVNDASGVDTVRSYLSSYALGSNIENGVILSTSGASLAGNDLANTLIGNTGDDVLYGYGGNDVLIGDAGNDVLDGGLGQDIFVFNTAFGPDNVDIIQNYVVGDDAIHLDSTVFSALLTTGTLAPDAFNIGTVAQDSSDRIIYNDATGELWYDADGAGGADAVKFATLVGVSGTMTNADFTVI